MSILENLLLAPMKVQGRKREEAVQEARELLARVHLSDKEMPIPPCFPEGRSRELRLFVL